MRNGLFATFLLLQGGSSAMSDVPDCMDEALAYVDEPGLITSLKLEICLDSDDPWTITTGERKTQVWTHGGTTKGEATLVRPDLNASPSNGNGFNPLGREIYRLQLAPNPGLN